MTMKAYTRFPSTAAAALFHSTPLLSIKKRIYWPERSHCRGPPRPRYKLVYRMSQVSGIIGFASKLNDQAHCRAENKNTQDSSSKYSGSYSSSNSSKLALDDTTSDRLTLGLSATGPLNIENIKLAYRECAVKWHPDRHQGLSKAFAEDKFKICNAAYQSLSKKLSSS